MLSKLLNPKPKNEGSKKVRTFLLGALIPCLYVILHYVAPKACAKVRAWLQKEVQKCDSV